MDVFTNFNNITVLVVWFTDARVSSAMVMVFNDTFNNILVISRQSVLLVEETGVPGENNWPVACYWQTLSHNVISSTPLRSPEWDSNSQH